MNNWKTSKEIIQANTHEQLNSMVIPNQCNTSEIRSNGSSAKKARKINSLNSDSLELNESKSKVVQLTKNRNKTDRKSILNESSTSKNEIVNEKQINASISLKENGNVPTKSNNSVNNDSLNDLTVAADFTESFDNLETTNNLEYENFKINSAEISDYDLKNTGILGSHIHAQTASNNKNSNNSNNNKLLPKIIIKKDKSSKNTQVFYLNNIQISSQQQQQKQNQNNSKLSSLIKLI